MKPSCSDCVALAKLMKICTDMETLNHAKPNGVQNNAQVSPGLTQIVNTTKPYTHTVRLQTLTSKLQALNPNLYNPDPKVTCSQQ
jgi:hypothetical protein